MTLSHVIKVEKDQDMNWLDRPVASVKGMLEVWSDGPRGGEA